MVTKCRRKNIKRLLSAMLAVWIAAALALPAAAAQDGLWMCALSVGKADAILVGCGGETWLVDTGYARSMGTVRAAMERFGVTRLDAVVLTHTDDDHAGGLDWLARSGIEVGAWYASGMYTGIKGEKKHPMVRAAALRGETVGWLKRGDSLTLGGASVEVLAPEALFRDKDNNNSLVLRVKSADGALLLCGDMEFPEETVLLDSGQDVSCDVMKVANHADDDTLSPAFARAAAPKAAVISTSSDEKPETPWPPLVETLRSVGAEVYVTDMCTGGVLVRLRGGEAEAGTFDFEVPDARVRIAAVDAGDDLVTLANEGGDVSLAGWYLYSDRGEEMYAFPDDARLASGGTITVGTKSSPKGSYDLLWDDKKVIHDSKSDVIELYAPNGLKVSDRANGE